MTQYTDRKDKTYEFAKGFDEDGDFVLLSNDGKAFKVQTYQLKAFSPVFLDMLQTCGPDQKQEIELDASEPAVRLFALALKGSSEKSNITELQIIKEAIDLCERYNAPFLGRQLLATIRTNSINLVGKFELLVCASKVDDIFVGSKLLMDSNLEEYYTVSRMSRMSRLPSTWVFAILKALEGSRATRGSISTKYYWLMVSAI
nr:uncharacterized protein CI109_005296 [Kwoniella shandongensis]KAA5526340.1 hypothetical protein CI109_005296 [Kwoniella shandongensis]